jgi:hypothetical protein
MRWKSMAGMRGRSPIFRVLSRKQSPVRAALGLLQNAPSPNVPVSWPELFSGQLTSSPPRNVLSPGNLVTNVTV